VFQVHAWRLGQPTPASDAVNLVLALEAVWAFLFCRSPWPRHYTAVIPVVYGAVGPTRSGDATWYGVNTTPSRMQSGEWFDPLAMTLAVDITEWADMKGAWFQVCTPRATQFEGCVVAQAMDTGYLKEYRVLVDLSRGAFQRIAPLGKGRQHVIVRRIE